jgi:caa(3)-type oxidase subunit IV
MAGNSSKSHTFRWLMIFVALCALTVASFTISNAAAFAASEMRIPLIVGISILKALLVGLFFMHLWWELPWKYLVTVPALLMAIILTVSLVPDVMKRSEQFSATRDRQFPARSSAIAPHTPLEETNHE